MLCVANKVPVRLPNRKLKTWKFAGKFLWKNAAVQNKSELGRWTRDQLLELGPTFVKLGQIASTRADLYPPEFTKELETLQDDVPPVEFDTFAHHDIFKEFDPIPFKSASIGQVHMAVLHSGQKVVVKLKRPGILETMKEDTDNIRDIVYFLERIGIDTGNSSGYVLDESIQYLLGEADYLQEIENAIEFKKSLKGGNGIKIQGVKKNYPNVNRMLRN